MRGIWMFASLGTTLALGAGLFVFGGYFLDHRLGTGVAFTATGAVAAFAYGAYEIRSALKRMERENGQPGPQTGADSRPGNEIEGSGQEPKA